MANIENTDNEQATKDGLFSPKTFHVAGVKFRPDWKSFVDLDISQPVTLIGEPQNQYDRYAVKVLLGTTHIGYVPKPINVDIWAVHKAGYKAEAKLLHFTPEAESWHWFEVQVTFKKL